jgi:hypothetical protein
MGAVLLGLLLTGLLATAPCLSSDGHAAHEEWYVGVYGGLAKPGALTNVTATSPTIGGGVQDARLIDIELEDSMVWGAKVGYFFPKSPWIGLETDVYTLRPDLKQQVTFGGVPGQPFADVLPATPLRVTAGVVNLVIRSPGISERFQPYGGMGFGAFMTTSSRSKTSISPGLNLFAGARYVLTERLALFGEFKFNHSTLTFTGIEGNYSTQLFMFGMMWHFKQHPPSTTDGQHDN